MLALFLHFALDLFTPQAHSWYEVLLQEGGYGKIERERAAFLIRERDGGLTLQPWSGAGFRHATFRGEVPPGALAVLHTHPAREPNPSRQDRAVARRLGMPVVVITPEGVIAAMPEGGPDLTILPVTGEKRPGRASGTSRVPSGPHTSPPR